MTERFDLIVLGAGSGGLTLAQRAAKLGARVALFEPRELGGTCVHRGCVPKKAMWFAAQFAQSQQLASAIGFTAPPATLDWTYFRKQRDRYIAGIAQRYAERLETANIRVIPAAAHFVAADTVAVDSGERFSAPQIAIVTGARPRQLDIPGFALGITSDGVFALDAAPARIGIVGGGYIAVEFACILHALGCDVELLLHKRMLEHFETDLVERLAQQMRARGIRIVSPIDIAAAHGKAGAVSLEDRAGGSHGVYDTVLWAIGRTANTEKLGLDALGVRRDAHGHVLVDAWQNTSVTGITALGDVTDRRALTPVAVAAGHALAERLFGGQPEARFDYEAIPTVAFAQPPLGMVGLTEAQAREQHGDAVRVHAGHFTPLQYWLAGQDAPSAMKLVCVGEDERVVGIHSLGPGTEELLQGFAVALRHGITRHELRSAVAIHPTAAEELLLLR